MLTRPLQGAVATTLIDTVSAANTSAATSAWVAVPVGWAGDVGFLVHTGAITGSVAGVLQTADDNSGTGARTVTFSDATSAFTAISTANQKEWKVVDRAALGTYAKYTGTVVTGPVLISVTMHGVPKTA